jgi:FHS family L-fucose permease-like MFS transporter
MHVAPGAMTSLRPATRSTALIALALIVSLFFLWGVANNLNDILVKQFKKAFELSDFKAGLVQSAFYMGYFVLAIPASICMRRFGYKGALLVGLSLYAAGAFLFYPAAAAHTYGLFLIALFVIASGLSFLETSANPLVTVLGSPDRAAWRLNLAQSFNPLGSIAGILIGQRYILSGIEHTPGDLAAMSVAAKHAYYTAESAAVRTPYLVIGSIVVVWAIMIAFARFPTTESVAKSVPAGGSLVRSLVRNQNLMLAVAAQFFYVGAQIGMWSYLIRYTQAKVPGFPEKAAANFLTISLTLFMLGRFAGTGLMRYIQPARLLAVYATILIGLLGSAIVVRGIAGVYALVIAPFFMSVMFPTIFALGLRGLDDDGRKLASSFLVMAIVGGAVVTAAMGAVSDQIGIQRAMAVPMLCFAVVLGFAYRTRTAGSAV